MFFALEAYPGLDACLPLFPQNFLVSYTDVIPGLQRFDHKGNLTHALVNATTTLANAVLCPAASVVVHGMTVRLPAGISAVLADLLVVQSSPTKGHGRSLRRRGIAATLGDLDGEFSVRLSVHNGRGFLGGTVATSLVLHPVRPGKENRHGWVLQV